MGDDQTEILGLGLLVSSVPTGTSITKKGSKFLLLAKFLNKKRYNFLLESKHYWEICDKPQNPTCKKILKGPSKRKKVANNSDKS